jgi:hypothetical protein
MTSSYFRAYGYISYNLGFHSTLHNKNYIYQHQRKSVFSKAVIDKLKYYVYFLQNPRNENIFYVGKGIGNRVFQHLNCAIETDGETEKFETIREIINSGEEVKHFILRHGLTEDVAFEIEASLIDLIGIKNLTNLQSGHYSDDFGLKTTDEISAMYEPQELVTSEAVILININKLYRRDMTATELYEATRKSWVLGSRREQAKYAIATYQGLTREVYEIENWYPIEANNKDTRWGFNGILAENKIREVLRYKSITSFFRKGAANPIRYLNC